MKYGNLNALRCTGEGNIKLSQAFNDENTLWKLDVIGDWKRQINRLYEDAYDEHQKQVYKDHPHLKRDTFETILSILGHDPVD